MAKTKTVQKIQTETQKTTALLRKGALAYVGLYGAAYERAQICLLYTSPSPRDRTRSRMPSSA